MLGGSTDENMLKYSFIILFLQSVVHVILGGFGILCSLMLVMVYDSRGHHGSKANEERFWFYLWWGFMLPIASTILVGSAVAILSVIVGIRWGCGENSLKLQKLGPLLVKYTAANLAFLVIVAVLAVITTIAPILNQQLYSWYCDSDPECSVWQYVWQYVWPILLGVLAAGLWLLVYAACLVVIHKQAATHVDSYTLQRKAGVLLMLQLWMSFIMVLMPVTIVGGASDPPILFIGDKPLHGCKLLLQVVAIGLACVTAAIGVLGIVGSFQMLLSKSPTAVVPLCMSIQKFMNAALAIFAGPVIIIINLVLWRARASDGTEFEFESFWDVLRAPLCNVLLLSALIAIPRWFIAYPYGDDGGSGLAGKKHYILLDAQLAEGPEIFI